MFQLPSGLGNGGLLTFASQSNNATDTTSNSSLTVGQSYGAGFGVALQLVSVSIGLTVGLLARYVARS
jgi:hypothetical protein